MASSTIEAMRRPLPSPQESVLILKARRTRPAAGPPPAAGRALTATLKALDARFGKGDEGLKARWREVVGEALARRTEPVRLSQPRTGGPAALELRVEGPAATLIQHQAPDIIARVNLYLGAGTIDRVRIVQGPLRGGPQRKAPVRAAPPIRLDQPLDAAAERDLAQDLDGMPDGPLKAAFMRLGRAMARRGAL
jgi:hypothetical protein